MKFTEEYFLYLYNENMVTYHPKKKPYDNLLSLNGHNMLFKLIVVD